MQRARATAVRAAINAGATQQTVADQLGISPIAVIKIDPLPTYPSVLKNAARDRSVALALPYRASIFRLR